MGDIDLTKTVSSDVTLYLNTGAIILVITILALMVILFWRYKGKVIPLFLGILGYVTFIGVAYNMVAALIYAIPGVEDYYKDNRVPLTLVYVVVSVLLFTIGRILCTKIMYSRYNKPGDVLNLGFGLGLGDALSCVLSTVALAVWAAGINSVGLAELLKNLNEKDAVNTYHSVSTLFSTPSIFWLALCISTVLDIILSCALAILIYGVISKKLSAKWYAFSAGINFLVVLPFQLYDNSTTAGIMVPFCIKVILFVVAMVVIYRVDIDYVGDIIGYKVDKTASSTKMPKFGRK